MKKVAGSIQRKTMLYETGVEYGNYTMNHVLGCAHGCKFPCYAYLQKKRKPENVGKVFAFPGAYRVVSFLAAVMIPISFVSLLLEVTEIPAQGNAGAAVLIAVCLVVGILVHFLAERLYLGGRKRYDYEQSIEEPAARAPLLRRRRGMQHRR